MKIKTLPEVRSDEVNEMARAGWTLVVRSYGHTPLVPDYRASPFGNDKAACGFFSTFVLVGENREIFAKTLMNTDIHILSEAIEAFKQTIETGRLFVQRSGARLNTCINHG